MGEIEKRQIYQEMRFNETDQTKPERVLRVLMETKYDVIEPEFVESDLDDSSSSSPSSCSPLFELSELMAQLPIKRGLSKFYQGKSESFALLTSVESIEDLAKKSKYSCRSRKSMKRLSPKANIAKNKKGHSSIFSSLGNLSSLMAN